MDMSTLKKGLWWVLLILIIIIIVYIVKQPAEKVVHTAPKLELETNKNIQKNPKRNAYFGEMHVHTSYSLDAFIGGFSLNPDQAYRFAKGEAISVGGVRHQLKRPLDFAAVTDHAEYIGEMYTTLNKNAQGHNQKLLEELRNLPDYKAQEAWFLKYVVSSNRGKKPQHPPFFTGDESSKSAWQVILTAAKQHYNPGVFTTIPAFEWSAAPNGGNLHRNIFFRDMNVPARPMSYIDINREEQLWDWLQSLEDQGMRVFAVPHNSNASKGMMFNPLDSKGNPIDAEYARKREHFERLIEMMQVKGNSEVHAKFWSNDEFADFENANSIQNYSNRTFSKSDFVRDGLAQGIKYKQSLGVNPYHYGISGGTDNHNGTPGNVYEDNWRGSHGGADGTIERRRNKDVGGWILAKDLSPGSITGVWAKSNTREDIWDAMYDRETFATSGPRIKVRLFAGFDLGTTTLVKDMVEEGYAKGVAMGGSIKTNNNNTNLIFSVYAQKDPIDANLDRIQIIKSWIDSNGKKQEKIFDVAWSGEKRLQADGKLSKIGNTVDLSTATYKNTIGATQLYTTWEDKEFNPQHNAVYYARVLQIPTPRWSTYDAIRNNLPLQKDIPATVVERAWTSPIWYNAQE